MCAENTHPDSELPLTFNGHSIDNLPLAELIALRRAAHDCQQWPEMAGVRSVLAALVEATQRAIVLTPMTTLHDFCQVIVAFSDPKNSWASGLIQLRPHACAALGHNAGEAI